MIALVRRKVLKAQLKIIDEADGSMPDEVIYKKRIRLERLEGVNYWLDKLERK